MKRTTPGTTEATQAIKALKLLAKVAAASFSLYIKALINAEATVWLQVLTDLLTAFQLIQESNDSITQMKSIESLVSLSAKVDFECRVSVVFMFLFYVMRFS